MAMEIIYVPLFALGLVILLKGADIITDYSSRIARALGVSEIVIGITLVSFATSLPELAVVVTSAFGGVSSIATGTIVGSNIANIGLVFALAALFSDFFVKSAYLKQASIMLSFSFLVSAFFIDGFFWFEGVVLIILSILYIFWLVKLYNGTEPAKKPTETHKRLVLYAFLCLFGGIAVILGANFVVTSAVGMAQLFGVSETMISLIIIAIGTSLPELVTSVVAARKKLRGISLGNIIGSNIFNITILSISSLIAVVPATTKILFINIPIMLLLALLLLVFIKTRPMVSKVEGMIFLMIYAVFVTLQFVGI